LKLIKTRPRKHIPTNLASKGLHTRGGTETLVKAGHVTSQILGGKLNYTEGGVVEEWVCKFHIFGEI
jgi:hypothetical protein